MRPEERDAAHVWDMLEASRELLEFVGGLRFADYEKNRLLQAAVERKLEILGEAARRVSEVTKDLHPEIPWRGIIAQRNVLAHEYGEIKQERVWFVVSEKLPEMVRLLEKLLPE